MAKGGTYEHTIIRKLAKAFAPLAVQEDDVYRTKNSGATKSQPGDIQLSPRFAKLFPVLVECKHYKIVKYQLGKSVNRQDASFRLFSWWKQVVREQKERPDKKGILVFRQNHCPDLVALRIDHFQDLCGMLPKWEFFTWSMFTAWKKETIVICHFDEFLDLAVKAALVRRLEKKASKRK